MKKTQILYIHGGMTFRRQKDYEKYLSTIEVSLESRKKWQDEYLDIQLGKNFEIIRPKMPLKENARYKDWKIFFEKYLKLLDENYILIGFSLGGIFLAKYLSENKLNKKPKATFLIGAPFDNTLSDEELCGGFVLKSNLSLLEKNSLHTHLMFSEDDPIVPVVHAYKFQKKLNKSIFYIYKNKNGHFGVPVFPELVKLIKRSVE